MASWAATPALCRAYNAWPVAYFALGQIFPMVPGREHVTSQLALIGPDGRGLQVLTAAGDHAGFPSWSPDGKRLVFRSAGPQGRALRILDLAANRITDLTNGSHNDNFPSWSPKGDRIAFTTDRDGDYEILDPAGRYGLEETDAQPRQRCALVVVAGWQVDCVCERAHGVSR